MNKVKSTSNKMRWATIAIILSSFAILDGFFLYYSYTTEVQRAETTVLNELRAIARSAAMQVDGDEHEKLEKAYLKKDDITSSTQDSSYYKVHNILSTIKEKNKLETTIYTMMLDRDYIKNNGKTKFVFGVSSDGTFYRHEYVKVPQELLNNFAIGGLIRPYETENGVWLSAFEPIYNSNNQLVAIVQVDQVFDSFLEEAFKGILSSIFFSIVIFILIILTIIKVNKQADKLRENIEEQKEVLKNLANYAKKIGKGMYDAQLENVSKNDVLGKALIKMGLNLKKNKERDIAENWLALGRDKVTTVLRENNSLEITAYNVLEKLINYLDVVQGGFFLLTKENQLTLSVSYAYGRKKHATANYQLGVGLIGESAIEQKTIHRTEIPENHLTITSGLINDKKPSAILIVPLVTEEKLQGVIELAGFEPFTDLQIKLVEELAEIVARSIYNLKINEQTANLLKESQQMTAELKEQQAKLEQNAVEMQIKQEEIERTNAELEYQIEEVNNAQKRQYTLLENASEIITIYDKDGITKYESPSIKRILGYEPEELIGQKVSAVFNELFEFLIKNPKETKTIQLQHNKKDNTKVWMETTGRNFLKDPAINGIIFNSTDITERRKAEREQIMRGKMQALSENSGDIIIRFDLKGNFQYVNPVLEKYTQFNKTQVIGKTFNEINFNDKIKTAWKTIIEKVEQNKKLVEMEMEFPTKDELKIMAVNALPEFDENGNLDTILVVSHDITNRKKQEVILEETNKKITDSINYAKRIQNAIIPSINEIQKDIKNTFMFYKPKDVVSGDFPYYFKKGDTIYYAAVDCTGHGVPGAMMSLIGHLLLNDILNGTETLTPAKVLDKLHIGVVKTLKQDEGDGVKTADGMDVALCSINLKTKKVQYAGAHRPLYLVRNNELTEFKGDRFPIGGSQYSGRTNFTNHVIDILENDAVYFFSDGLPDQFGGPEKLKYGPKRIREGIMENNNKKPNEIKTYFEKSYHEWMGNMKQIDDVLLIGIKF